MNNFLRLILIIAFTGLQYCSTGQQLYYTVEESEAIHDSINHSRWDVGGRLSQYSFRYMSEFFPIGVIHKPNTPYQYRYKPKKSFDDIIIKTAKVEILFLLKAI